MDNEPLTPGATLSGDSGCIDTIREVLAERRKPLLCVHRKSFGNEEFVVRNLVPGEYEYPRDLQRQLSTSPSVRAFMDRLQTPEIFIYLFLKTDLLQFSDKGLNGATKKSMLKKALTGLAALHNLKIRHVLIRDVEKFATEDGLKGLLRWIGEGNPFVNRLVGIKHVLSERARVPFQNWTFVDPLFRHLIGKTTHLHPSMRITAREALKHPWFAGVE